VLYIAGQYTAGNGTFVHDAIRIAGGRNIAAAAGIEGYQTISDEVVVERDPEWIVHTGSGGEITYRSAYQNTTAIRTNQTIALDANLLTQPAPRVVVALTRLAKALHPVSMADVPFEWTAKEKGNIGNAYSGTVNDSHSVGSNSSKVDMNVSKNKDKSSPTPVGSPFRPLLTPIAIIIVLLTHIYRR
jgi:iron complex transport system substrate-binding protein